MKFVFSIAAIVLLAAPLTLAQPFDEQTIVTAQTYANVAEVKRMVTLTPAQEQAYTSCCAAFYTAAYVAVFEEKEVANVSLTIVNARQSLTDTLLRLLNEEQRVTYIRNAEAGSVKLKTEEKMTAMRELGGFSQQELEKAYQEIYDYFLLERVVHVQQMSNIEAVGYKKMPKKPTSLVTAMQFARLKVSGAMNNENKYKWQ